LNQIWHEYLVIIYVSYFTIFLSKCTSRKFQKNKIGTEFSKITFCRFWVSEKLYEKGSSHIYSKQIILDINVVYACDLQFREELLRDSSILLEYTVIQFLPKICKNFTVSTFTNFAYCSVELRQYQRRFSEVR
jgi:hypothetical protein